MKKKKKRKHVPTPRKKRRGRKSVSKRRRVLRRDGKNSPKRGSRTPLRHAKKQKKKGRSKPPRRAVKKRAAPRPRAPQRAVRPRPKKKTPVRDDGLKKLPSLVGPVIHVFPGRGVATSFKMSEKDRDALLLERAREAYEAGSLDQDYLDIALELGVSDHDAYSAAFGYLPMTAGVAA